MPPQQSAATPDAWMATPAAQQLLGQQQQAQTAQATQQARQLQQAQQPQPLQPPQQAPAPQQQPQQRRRDTVPMMSPDYKKVYDVTLDQVGPATQSGWQAAQAMVKPDDGSHVWVPQTHVEEMKRQRYTPIDNNGNFYLTPFPDEGHQEFMQRAHNATQWMSQHPALGEQAMHAQWEEEKPGIETFSAAVAALMGSAAAAPGAIPMATSAVRAIGAWARANPAVAITLGGLLVKWLPGFKKVTQTIKDIPLPGYDY